MLDLVPADNFYRRLQAELDLQFIYNATKKYYGTEGQESIDPVVFFKILLVGYLNNINSDRRLMAYCSDSLSIRLFLGYDVHESLPWHSTISRTRQLYGEAIFLDLFKLVLKMAFIHSLTFRGFAQWRLRERLISAKIEIFQRKINNQFKQLHQLLQMAVSTCFNYLFLV